MPVFDGHVAINGVDTSSDPGLIGSGSSAIDSVNRSYRGGVCRTRDPFFQRTLEFDTSESKDVFENGNVSGVFGYRKINNQIQAHIIVAVGNMLLAGRVFSEKISFKCIYNEIDPQWQHSFFVQAEEILVWQNGKQTPQIWDGLSAKTVTSIEAVANLNSPFPMPIGNVMVYAHGRIFVATEENIVFASDHIYSQGFGKNVTVTNFSETTYPSSGDGFGSYSQIGRITGMAVAPRHPEPNGHGEVIVCGENGAWAIDPTPVRNTWTDLAIQQVILIGRGIAAPYSIVPVNNDLFYRSSDRTISSIRSSIVDREQRWSYKSLSREVQRYLNYDTLDPLQFSHGIFANNRLIMSCAHRMERSNGYGNHRFGLGMVALDFDRGNTTNNVDEGFSWDGLWTGPRTTGMVNLTVDCYERYLFCSYDSDGKNRIYELRDVSDNDFVQNKKKPIKGFYVIGDLFSGGSKTSTPTRSKLNRATAYLSDINNEAKVSVDYRPDRHPLWSPLMSENTVGHSDPDDPSHLNEEETLSIFQGIKKYSDIIGSESPDRTKSRNAVSHSISSGWSFQLKINTEGVIAVNRIAAEADLSELKTLTNLVDFRKEEKYTERETGDNEEAEFFNYKF